MAAWSSVLRYASQKLNGVSLLLFKKSPLNSQVRCMSEHRVMNIQPSRWQWDKMKDLLHFYFMLGAIPCTLITIYAYVFVGPATLEPIPEGYRPKYWEYYRNPITRFYVRYISTSPQQEYEKYLHVIWMEQKTREAREIDQRVHDLIKARHDSRYFYYRPTTAKYFYQAKELAEDKYWGTTFLKRDE